ncbi:MAG: sigma-54 dependent transcriptional regulator [Thermodesulfovibrionales bacterium]
MKHRALIIEDDNIMRVSLEDSLKANGYEAVSYEKGIDGVNAFKEGGFSLVITDVRLPDMRGLDILKLVKENNAETPVIVMTGFGTIKDAVDAMKIGAFDYLTKPFSLEEFILIAERALEDKELREENVRLRRDLTKCYNFPNIIGESAEMGKVYDLIEKVARTDSNVLIRGENGTGKELVASTIHYQSGRKSGPLIKVNCAALPENLIESELFGYEKGAFTGALKRKPGRFERADKGTIFMDEIGDMPSSVQVKLLRVLQDGSFERLGGTETLYVDVRVIAASNRNLEEDVKENRFREDLYYRLNVIPVHIPPLRERREDIPLLLDHFLDIYNCRYGRKIELSSDAIVALMDYGFPGNVRELENIAERCITLSTNDTITRDALPSHIVKGQEVPYREVTLSGVAAEAARDHIIRILRSTKGNRTKAAEILGISRKTLWEKVKAYSIEY